jgi:hypothetical protein
MQTLTLSRRQLRQSVKLIVRQAEAKHHDLVLEVDRALGLEPRHSRAEARRDSLL